ncbi:MAG: hypothetical protein ABI609_06265 [Acidobacteriota bacterium]
MKTSRFALASLLALLAMPVFAVTAAPADARTTAVAADGAVYVATAGTYGALFPHGSAAAATTPVLALDITSADGDSSRVLVAGTDDAAAEEAPLLFTQDPTGDVYLVWSSRSGAAASLLLRAYSNGEFSDSVTLDDNPFAAKGAPQVALTRDAFTTVDARGVNRAVQRSVLHLLWWEGGAQGGGAKYRSVLFVNGGLVGANGLIDLGNLDTPGIEATADRVSDALTRSPVLARGRNERAALIGFVNPRSGRLLTVEVGVVPGELSSLADDLSSYIVGLGATGGLGDMQHVGDAVRIHIIGGGRRISERVLQALGPDVASHVVANGRSFGGDAVALANDTRRFLLREGANLLANGIDSPDLLANNTAIVELPADAAGITNQLQFRVMGQRPAPTTPENASRIHASPDGTQLVVSWDGANDVGYTEWLGKAWSAPRSLHLDTIDRAAAETALDRRVAQR